MAPYARSSYCCREADRRTELAIRFLRRLRYREYLPTAHWDRIRALALERARHACALCTATLRLEVHHRTYARKGFEQPEDVVVLCDECHSRHHGAVIASAGERYALPRAPLVHASSIRWLIKGA